MKVITTLKDDLYKLDNLVEDGTLKGDASKAAILSTTIRHVCKPYIPLWSYKPLEEVVQTRINVFDGSLDAEYVDLPAPDEIPRLYRVSIGVVPMDEINEISGMKDDENSKNEYLVLVSTGHRFKDKGNQETLCNEEASYIARIDNSNKLPKVSLDTFGEEGKDFDEYSLELSPPINLEGHYFKSAGRKESNRVQKSLKAAKNKESVTA